MDSTNTAICETTSNAVFIIDFSITKKNHFFQAALKEARQAFDALMLDFGKHQKLERYEKLMLTHVWDPNNKNKPAYKNIALIVTKQITLSRLVPKKQRDNEDKEKYMLDQNLLRNRLYNTFVLPPMIEQNDMSHDIELEVYHEVIIRTKITAHRTDTVLHLEIVLVMTKVLLLHKTLVHVETNKNDSRDPLALLIDH